MKESTIIHVPHASVSIPDEYKSSFCAEKVQREIDTMTDWFCDELFECGAEQLIFPVSRLVCDVERFRDDRQEIMSRIGMGAIYQSCSDLSPLRKTNKAEKEQLLRRYYDTHHRKFADAVRSRLSQYGKCLIIDAHSFYPTPLPYELDKTEKRPDFCIGTSECHTPDFIADLLDTALKEKGYSVKRNSPFAGTIVPMAFYGKDTRVISVMIEVNRKLYLDRPGVKNENFSVIKSVISECITLIESLI